MSHMFNYLSRLNNLKKKKEKIPRGTWDLRFEIWVYLMEKENMKRL